VGFVFLFPGRARAERQNWVIFHTPSNGGSGPHQRRKPIFSANSGEILPPGLFIGLHWDPGNPLLPNRDSVSFGGEIGGKNWVQQNNVVGTGGAPGKLVGFGLGPGGSWGSFSKGFLGGPQGFGARGGREILGLISRAS